MRAVTREHIYDAAFLAECPLDEPTRRLVSADGLGLRVWDYGGHGPSVLFLHGYLDTGRSFAWVINALDGHVRALAMEWRGHGESDDAPPGGSYHALDHLKDLSHALADLEREGFVPDLVVGHSMGGAIAALFAGAWPEKVPRLLLIDALGAPSEAPEDQPVRIGELLKSVREKKPFRSFESAEAAVARLMENNPGISEVGARRIARHALVRDADLRWRYRFDHRMRGPTPVRYPETMWLALFSRVTAKTIVLRAEHGILPDIPIVHDRIAAMHEAHLETIRGATHNVHVEQPEAIAEAMQRLLA